MTQSVDGKATRKAKQSVRIAKAWHQVQNYEAYLKVRGKSWTHRHYLGLGTNRFQINLSLLKNAYATLCRPHPPELDAI